MRFVGAMPPYPPRPAGHGAHSTGKPLLAHATRRTGKLVHAHATRRSTEAMY